MRMTDVYRPGEKIVLGSHAFSSEEIIRFASRYDPQPFHIDPEAAAHSLFGGLCASGWHTCAVWMRNFVDHWTAEAERLRGEGLQPPKLGPSPGFSKLQWLRPVFAGDTVRYTVTLSDTRSLASRPGWLLNNLICEGENQDGIPVLRFESKVLEFE